MASNVYKVINKLSKKTKFIFDLDKTIWDCTIEYTPKITLDQVHNKINPDAFKILRILQENDFSLNIASRSSEPEKCRFFINECFNDINFDNISIYPTPEYKNNHIQDCYLNQVPENFIMFDDEKNILDNLNKNYKNCIPIHCKTPLNFQTFMHLDKKI